jgi:hypothetical protein
MRSARTVVLASLMLAAMAALGPSASVRGINGGACKRPYDLVISVADFTTANGQRNVVDNPYFPLQVGTTFTYEGYKEGGSLRDVMVVTSQQKTIMGVPIMVVRDTAWEGGILAEDTFDWYAQDDAGNVWYFGEDTTEFDADGNVETKEGSWEAGADGAKPGILMLAQPRSGHTYRQEYAPGVAVDMATVMSLSKHANVPYGSFTNVVATKEFSCIEQGISHKYYVRGLGLVQEVQTSGGKEGISLVSLSH